MIAAAASTAVRGILIRTAVNIIRVAIGMLVVLCWSCTSGTAPLTDLMAQPGGTARLRSAASLQLDGNGTINGAPIEGAPGFVGPVPGSAILPAPPADQWAAMVAASANAPCKFPGPQYLAALAFYESGYGTNPGPSSAGAWGYGQFMPETLAAYGISWSQATDYRVMLPSMVLYLCRAGIATDIGGALYSYNHSAAYVQHVEALAASLPVATATNQLAWQDLPAFNQFDPRNWSNTQNFQIWSAAACSAAALDWMLTAYGTPPGSLDAAVSLIGPNTGISARQGLLDHTGTPLASALVKAGYPSWQAHLNQQQLVERLRQGPAMLDGQGWFGEGHWFVAIGSDSGGIVTRESSGNNVQYLTWSRLFGEVGWSGWAVGISAPVPSNQA